MTTSSTPAFRLFTAEQNARLGRASEVRTLLASAVRFAMQAPARLRRTWRTWNTRLQDRHFLADLRKHQIHEMGLTLDERDREIRKPFWQA